VISVSKKNHTNHKHHNNLRSAFPQERIQVNCFKLIHPSRYQYQKKIITIIIICVPYPQERRVPAFPHKTSGNEHYLKLIFF